MSTGFYWVIVSNHAEVAYWDGTYWQVCGTEELFQDLKVISVIPQILLTNQKDTQKIPTGATS
jgi:hypothetical protein